VLVARSDGKADLHRSSEHLGSNIGTAQVVAEIFSELFFAPVRSREACLNRHLRNGESP